MALINEFFDRAASGGDAMLLFGEPGVGQKMLLDVAADPAMACEVWVLRTVEGTRVVELKPSAHRLTLPHPPRLRAVIAESSADERLDRARRLADAAYVSVNVAGDLRRAETLLAEADLTASVETATAASCVLLHGDGDVAAAHRVLLRAIETADGRDISLTAAEGALRTLLLVCHFGGRAELWEPLDRYLLNFGPDLAASLSLSATLVADPARSPGAALDRLDAEIESLPRLADPAEIVRIAGMSAFVDRLPHC